MRDARSSTEGCRETLGRLLEGLTARHASTNRACFAYALHRFDVAPQDQEGSKANEPHAALKALPVPVGAARCTHELRFGITT